MLGLSAITNAATGGPEQEPDTIEAVLENAAVAGGVHRARCSTACCPSSEWPRGKARSVALVAFGVVCAMSLWFVSAAILPEIVARGRRSAPVAPRRCPRRCNSASSPARWRSPCTGPPTASTRAGCSPPRRSSRRARTSRCLRRPLGGAAQVALRAMTGAALAGVYPVGMRIAVGWGLRDRGLLVGLIVGAVTLGSAQPAPDRAARRGRLAADRARDLDARGARRGCSRWPPGSGRRTPAPSAFEPGALRLAWTDRRVRLAFLGYFGHMWELYAFWAWIGAAATVALAPRVADAPTTPRGC